MDKKKNGIPKLRFPGFTGAWEQRKLGDFIIEFHEKTIVNNQYPILTSSRKGIFLQTEYYSGNQVASKDNTGYNIVPYGYFTYRHMSDDNIFRFNINKIVDKGIVSTLYPVFTTNKHLDSRYLQIQLNHGNEFAKYALLQKQGGSRTYMYLSKLKKLILTMPNSTTEQRKISEFFDTFDSLIALHQRKLDHLKEQKKGLLQKMFPKKGEVVPEVRFPGFTNAWEQRKLGEVVEMFNGDRGRDYPKNSELVAEGIPFINAGDLQDGQVNLETCKRISREKFNQLGGAKIKRGDILYCLRGTIGKNALVDNFDEGTVASSLVDIRPKKIDEMYLFIILNSDIEYRQRVLTDEGAAQPNLSVKNISKFNIPTPEIEEQYQIAEFFKSINSLIALHQRKLDHLKLLKKGLLQQMFV